MDVAFSGVLLLLLTPLFAVLASLIRFSSPGPVFFRQERVGLNGEPFRLFKFRSMRVQNSGPSVTAGDDDRITPIGKILRRSKLDELPQLLNVLRGEMSLVGPRPEVQRFVAHYTAEQRHVLTVRPGITGLSQIEYRDEERLLAGRDDVEDFYIREVMPRKLEIDLRYLRERSLAGDFILLFRTGLALFRR
jgi:lipopolysaccharide/colanic/teichoic acid biosynthesis glycosyltransferase